MEGIRLYQQGRSLSHAALLRSAESRLLIDAERASPRAPELFFYLGATAAALGRHEDAVKHYASSLSLDPQSAVAYENMAIAMGEAGRPHQAAAAFEAAIRLSPRAEAYSMLAATRMEMGLPAEDEAASALSLAPQSAEIHYEIARADELFAEGKRKPLFAKAQQLAAHEWRRRMGCEPIEGPPTRQISRWDGGAVVRRVLLREGGEAYGRLVPRPFSDASWPPPRSSGWPHLRFVERSVWLIELRNVWISGECRRSSRSDFTCQALAICEASAPTRSLELSLSLALPPSSRALTAPPFLHPSTH